MHLNILAYVKFFIANLKHRGKKMAFSIINLEKLSVDQNIFWEI